MVRDRINMKVKLRSVRWISVNGTEIRIFKCKSSLNRLVTYFDYDYLNHDYRVFGSNAKKKKLDKFFIFFVASNSEFQFSRVL